MQSEPIIQLHQVSKSYRVYTQRRLLLASIWNQLRQRPDYHLFDAISDITFNIHPGEILGIIGRNGSGKSTILKMISGITTPSSGSIHVRGRVVSLLELGVGFALELTGRENIFLYGSLIGLPKHEIRSKVSEIIAFSGLGSFIEEPVRNYSSGMLIRLAFAVAAHADPDILLLDEVLGVGDIEFQNRCFQFIQSSIQKGVAIVLVSHDMSVIGNFCHRVICLENGSIQQIGDADRVVNWYLEQIRKEAHLARITVRDLEISLQRGSFQIYWQRRPITSAHGCTIFLRRQDHLYPATEAFWQVLSQDRSGMLVKGHWPAWNLVQRWHIRIETDRTISWHIEMAGDHLGLVDTIELYFSYSADYRQYITSDTIRAMPPIRRNTFRPESCLMRPHPRRFIGLTAHLDPTLPGPLIDFRDLPPIGRSQVLNGHAFSKSRSILRSLPVSDTTEYHTSIHVLNPDAISQYFDEYHDRASLENALLEVILIEMDLHIKANGRIVSSGKGFFATMDIDNLFLQQIEWELIRTENPLELRGTDQEFPVVYCWTFEAIENAICWTLHLEILDTIRKSLHHGIQIGELAFHDVEFHPETGMEPVQDGTILFTLPESLQSEVYYPGKVLVSHGYFTLRETTDE